MITQILKRDYTDRNKKAFSLILILLILALSFFSANAARANTISLDPAHVRLSAGAGEVKSGTLKIDNPSPDEVKIRVYLEDWRYASNSEGTKEFFPAGTMALSCAKWVDFSPAEFTVPAFGRQVVNYTVRVPQDAKGVHFSVMFFETDLTDNSAGSSESAVNLKARLGALFSVEAGDSLICEAALDNLALNRDNGVLKISGNFKNNGNTDISPEITFDIINSGGEVFARGTFSDIFTLPQDSGEVFAAAKDDLREGEYILVITLNLGRGRPKVLEVPINVGASGINVINS